MKQLMIFSHNCYQQFFKLHIHKDPLQIYFRKKKITPPNITIRFHLAFSVALHVISDKFHSLINLTNQCIFDRVITVRSLSRFR